MDTRNRVTIDPAVMMGKPVIRGTRIPVYVILNLIAEGQTPAAIVREYPDITAADIQAALQFASRMTQFEEAVVLKA